MVCVIGCSTNTPGLSIRRILYFFLASIISFYRAVCNITTKKIAFISALLALTFTVASSTIFSSIMMNSNLGAVFWASALYLSTTTFHYKNLSIILLLFLSALSYEAYIPLFLFIVLVPFLYRPLVSKTIRNKLFSSISVVISLLLVFTSRELLVFNNEFSRLQISDISTLLTKYIINLKRGITIVNEDTLLRVSQ